MTGGCGLATRIILGGVCDIINVLLEEKEPDAVLEPRAKEERDIKEIGYHVCTRNYFL